MASWWNELPSKIDPTLITLGGSEIFSIGSSADGSGFPLRYYGLMNLAAFFTSIKVIKYVIKKDELKISEKQLEGIITAVIIGIILGGRLGYVFFYNFSHYALNPNEIFWPFSNGAFVGISGMSYHGGLLGGATAALIYLKKQKMSILTFINTIALSIPIGYTWGRVGNFLNGELWGRETTAPIGMIFPTDAKQLIRHPSQLYEAFGEGVFLFALMFFLYQKGLFKKRMASIYLVGYAVARIIIEFFREPDSHIGLMGGISRGQILSTIMILTGVGLWIWLAQKEKSELTTN